MAPQEVELKFAAPPGRIGDLAAVFEALGAAEPRRLTSIYFDTDKGALRRAGLTLRVRREGEAFTQTLKDAGGTLSRGQWETPVKGPGPARAKLRGTPAARILAGSGRLSPRFTVEVHRRTADVAEGETRVEVSLDEGVARAGSREARFVELELELKQGPLWGLFALARRLTAGVDLTLSFTTKAGRGADVARPSRAYARRFEPPKLMPALAAGEAFQRVARACLAQVAGNAERLRSRASPEVIHQFRIGLRRLRSCLSSFKAVVADARLAAIKAELEWLTGELDAARDLDVLLQGDYRAALARREDPEGLKGLGARLRGARRMAYVRAADAVESERFRRLLLDLLIWIEAGPWRSAPAMQKARLQPIRRFAEKDLARRRKKVVAQGRRLRKLDPEHRHRIRIQAKKLRYGADVFAGLFDRPRRFESFIGALKEVQDSLGALNDIAVGQRLAHDTAGRGRDAPAEPAFVAGRITGAQSARIAPLMNRAEAAMAAFEDVRPFWT